MTSRTLASRRKDETGNRARGEPLSDLVAAIEKDDPGISERLGVSSAALRAGAEVRAMRLAARLSQSELASRLGWTQERISNIERGIGIQGPTYRVMESLKAACRTDSQSSGGLGTFRGFRPLHDRVVVRRLEREYKSTGGIIIPDTAKEKPVEGEVVAVGDGARNERGEFVPMSVKAGDHIMFGKWSGTEIKIDGEELLIMKEADIMGVVRDERKKAAAAAAA